MRSKEHLVLCVFLFACIQNIQLIRCQEIIAPGLPEQLSSNETELRHQLRMKRGQETSSVSGIKPAAILLGNFAVGTREFIANGVFPKKNELNLFEIEYVDKYKTYLLKVVPLTTTNLNKVDDSLVKGYWLTTAMAEEDKKILKQNVLKVTANEVKFVFTAEFQSCSVYAKVNSNSVEFFHYNRVGLHSIYVNMHEGSKISNNGNNFLGGDGRSIKFNNDPGLNPNKFFSRAGVEIRPVEGVIELTEALFIQDENTDERIEIEMINDKSVETLVLENLVTMNYQNDLRAKYDVEIRSEDYLGLPANYILLMAEKIMKYSFVTGFFHRKDSFSNWHFKTQRISYTRDNPTDKDFQRMFNIDNTYKCDIEIKKKELMDLPHTKHCHKESKNPILVTQ